MPRGEGEGAYLVQIDGGVPSAKRAKKHISKIPKTQERVEARERAEAIPLED